MVEVAILLSIGDQALAAFAVHEIEDLLKANDVKLGETTFRDKSIKPLIFPVIPDILDERSQEKVV